MLNQAKLNSIDLYEGYGLAVMSGLKNLESPADPKPSESYDWPERYGSEYVLTDKLADLDATFECAMVADTMVQLLANKDALYAVLRNGQFKTLQVIATGKTYDIKFNKTSGFDFVKAASGVAAKLNLEITIVQDALNNLIQTTILDGNGDGEFYQGMNYKNVATYAVMIAAGVPAVMTTYKVAVDEVKGMENTTYQRWPDGSITWVASVEEGS